MKKTLFVFICCIFFCGALFAFPQHMILLHGDIAYPGNSEVEEYFSPMPLTFNKDMRVFDAGLEYSYSMLGFLSLGLGVNYITKEYMITDSFLNWDDFVFNAVQPYAVIKLFYAVNDGFDLYAGGNGGIISLFASSLTYDGNVTAKYTGAAPAFTFFGGIAGKFNEIWCTLEAGYKIAQLKPYNYEVSPGSVVRNKDLTEARSNFGGFYFGASVGYGFGDETGSAKKK